MALMVLPFAAQADTFVRDDIVLEPEPWNFTVCHGNGCINLSPVSLTPDEWTGVTQMFSPAARSHAEEREQLRRAIAEMERLVGKEIGTSRDKGGTFNFEEGQMDCIDESINTTTYLTLFVRNGLMLRHRVEDRATRGWFFRGWPHTSAVISEIPTQGSKPRHWAVDSWFLDNGQPPLIIPLDVWRSGWQPE